MHHKQVIHCLRFVPSLHACRLQRSALGRGLAALFGNISAALPWWPSFHHASKRLATGATPFLLEVSNVSELAGLAMHVCLTGVDDGETALQAACRELFEESGFEAGVAELRQLSVVEDASRNTHTEYFSWGAPDSCLPASPEGRHVRWATAADSERLLMKKNGMIAAVRAALSCMTGSSHAKPSPTVASSAVASPSDDISGTPSRSSSTVAAAAAAAAAATTTSRSSTEQRCGKGTIDTSS